MTTPYCVVGCTRGTGLRIVQQLAARGAPVRCVARDPAKAKDLLPAGVDIRAGDVTSPGSLQRAEFGECRAIFFAVDISGGVAGRGFFTSQAQIRAVTYQGLVNVVNAAKAAAFTGRFILLSGMGSELPSFTGRLLNAIKGNLQRNQRDRNEYLRNSGLDWSIGQGGILTNEEGGTAAIRISPPVHRLSVLRRVARVDFARALIAAADAPAASKSTFDVFNEPGSPPSPPVHRLSVLRRVARADFARTLIAVADGPAPSRPTFDVFNEPGSWPSDEALRSQFDSLLRTTSAEQDSQAHAEALAGTYTRQSGKRAEGRLRQASVPEPR